MSKQTVSELRSTTASYMFFAAKGFICLALITTILFLINPVEQSRDWGNLFTSLIYFIGMISGLLWLRFWLLGETYWRYIWCVLLIISAVTLELTR